MKMASQITGFDIIGKIGEGSFSEVLKVREKASGRCYAAKKLRKLYENMNEVLNCPEIKAVRSLDYHPHIVGVIDIIYDPNTKELSLISELLDMNMYDFIKNRKRCLSEVKVKKFLYQLLCGLHHLHRHGIFHRDIKPENILIKTNTRLRDNPLMNEIVQLADLGSVCNIHAEPPHSSYISTRWYRAPETLLTSGYYGSKIDIWALGCVFYEMLTLNPLFPGETELDQLCKIHDVIGTPNDRILQRFNKVTVNYSFARKRSICFRDLVPWLSPNGIDVLNKTLVYHPDQRISVYKLLDHAYFNDLRLKNKKMTHAYSSTPSLNTFLRNSCIFPQSLAGSRSLLRSNSRELSMSLQTECCTKSWKKFMSRQSSPISELDTEVKLKMKERLWGMNPGRSKNKLIENIKERNRL